MLLVSLFLASCETNESTINELSELKQELEVCDDFCTEDWEDFTKRYDLLNERMDRRTYTPEEKREIRRLRGKIAAQITKKSISSLKKQAEEAPKEYHDRL